MTVLGALENLWERWRKGVYSKKDKNLVVEGACTGVCSSQHVSSYKNNIEKFKAKWRGKSSPLHPNDSKGKSFVDLLLKPSEEDPKCWPHRYELGVDKLTDDISFSSFEFRLRVFLTSDGDLVLISRVRNINGKPFSFSFAYHSYLLVSDISYSSCTYKHWVVFSEVRIGLETLDYLDNLCHKERFTEQGDAITFESEIDRVYLSTPNVIAVLDHERKRTFVIRKEGLPDVVVWNPWEKKSKAIMDFGDEEYKQMVCVDAAAIEKPITLKPGEEWTGRLEILVVPSSFCSDNLDPSPSLQP
ncbi:Aldose 1-/Glucose-6-phosphate 1-epimerase [Dillenia turbinata]|uniref:Aldose 1-/Glucose-6-phosphate 1-epimerase n=1 Tax=Dillenia turbinata TaxID=194707 RepID=A0AAN8UQW2_9MAGN